MRPRPGWRVLLVAACALSASGCRCGERSEPPPPIAVSEDASVAEGGLAADASASDAGEEVEHDDYRDVPMLVPIGVDAPRPAAEQAKRAQKLLETRGLPDDYRRALGLTNAAHDAGAKVDCRLFDLARDDQRLAQCYERAGQTVHLALLLASGRGVARDPERAAALLAASDRKDCTLDRARAAVSRKRRHAGGRPLAFCGDAACRSADIAECLADRVLRYDWTSSAGRQIVHDRLDDAGRDAYRALAAAFAAYADAGAKRALSPTDGFKQRFNHHRRFDALLEQVAVRHDFPHATDAELRQLAERIASLEREKSQSYARYEDAFAEFAKLAVPETADADRRTRALLRRDYIRELETRATR